jgi:hypothetical protein
MFARVGINFMHKPEWITCDEDEGVLVDKILIP